MRRRRRRQRQSFQRQHLRLTADARLAAHRRQLGEAEALARRAVELGENTDMLNTRARTWLALGDVVRLDGRETEVVLGLVIVAFRFGNKAVATERPLLET